MEMLSLDSLPNLMECSTSAMQRSTSLENNFVAVIIYR